MPVSRRDVLRGAAAGMTWLALGAPQSMAAAQPSAAPTGPRIGMCDWNLGKAGSIDVIPLARKIGLDGVEISVNFPGPGQHLRDPAVQREFKAVMKRESIVAPSVALGILNGVPLKSEPKAAIWLDDSIDVAAALGAKVILVAFFGDGELKMDNEREIARTVDVLKEMVPHAAKAKIILGLENTLSADDNLRLLERVGSPSVQVYYDFKNSADYGRDIPAEIRRLGSYICQVHVKNGGEFLSGPSNVSFPACGEALREIGYHGWYVLETASPTGDVVADTRANVEYVRKHFA